MIRKIILGLFFGLFLTSCIQNVDEIYLSKTDNTMLCAQSYKNRSLETSSEDKEKIRAELNRRGVICTEQFKWAYAPVNRPAEVPIDNTKANTVFKSEKVSKLENEERKTNIITNKNTKLDNSQFSKKCEGGVFSKGYKKGTQEFEDCIKREEKLVALDMQKKELINEEKNKRITLEENKKQKAIQQKQELDTAKIKEEQTKLSKMKPEDRHAYTCAEKFSFRKGSDKFKDCVFEMYKVETELEKLELQKKIIEANLEVARVKEKAARTEQDRNTALLERQTLAQERTAAAAAQQARISNFESSQRMIDDGLALMRGDRNLAGDVRAPRMRTTCTNLGGFITCN
jgi:hypothetical protein